jgi:hypothetical protein
MGTRNAEPTSIPRLESCLLLIHDLGSPRRPAAAELPVDLERPPAAGTNAAVK